MGYHALLPLGSQLFLGKSVIVAQTSPIATSGLYYILGSAMVWVDLNDSAVFCYDALTSNGSPSQAAGGSSGIITATLADALFINAGDSVMMLCYSGKGDASSFVSNAGLTATLITSGVNAKKARHSRAYHAPFAPGAVK
jgi:hypothetical protein